MEKGNLLVYDYFTITQEFDHPGDTMCVLRKQVLDYGVEYKNETSTCTTTANFDNYNFDPQFPPKFFGNEVAITEQEAYDKDTTYWSEKRQVKLTPEERQFIITKDSIYDAQHRTEYLDSIDKIFNKVTALKVLWWGIDHRNRVKRRNGVSALSQVWPGQFTLQARELHLAFPSLKNGMMNGG